MRHQPAPDSPIDIYGRVSKAGDKEQRSTGGQVAVCRSILAEHDLDAGMVHVDEGKSAWNPKIRRANWEVLMARLESRQAGGVIVFDLERFARRPEDGERLIRAAERGLLVLDSESEFDLTTPSGKKAFRDAMAAAAYYSDRLSTRVRRGKRAKALAGAVDSHRSFGFDDDGVTVRESEAVWLRWLAEHLLHGDPQDALAAHLNARGVMTVHEGQTINGVKAEKAGGPWTTGAVRDVMSRPRNAGHLVHRGATVAELPGEPIISQRDHDRLLSLFAARRRGRPNSPAYLCSCGVAVCGLCGKRLSGRPRTGRTYSDGGVRREYWCSPAANGGCAGVFADQRVLDDFARDLALTILSDPHNARRIEAQAAQHDEQAIALDTLIGDTERTALALADRLGRGELSLARYDAATRPLDARLAELKASRAALGNAAPQSRRGDWTRRWETASADERRDILRLALGSRQLVIAACGADIADRVSLG